MKKLKPLTSGAFTANPQLYRAYHALEAGLVSKSDSDLVTVLNIYIDTAQKQGFLVEAAQALRDSLRLRITSEEAALSRRVRDDSTGRPTATAPGR